MVELQIELAKQEVIGRDIADQRNEHASAALLTRQHQSGRGLLLTPDSSKQVELPRELKSVGAALMRCRVVPLCDVFDACRTP